MEDNYKEKLEIKIKKIALVIAMVANIFVCLCINFSEILSVVPIGNKNRIVAICYLLVWILIIVLARYLKSKKLLKLFLGYWVFNILVYFLVTLLFKFDIYSSIINLLFLIFIGPMHGLFFSNSIIIVITIDVLISIFIFYFIKKTP